MDSVGDVSVTYEKVCDRNGFCLVRILPIQEVTMIEEDKPKQERSVEESINYIDEVLEALEK